MARAGRLLAHDSFSSPAVARQMATVLEAVKNRHPLVT
jgi:hypothetical protein